jgi:hypothetical protein
MYRIIDGRSSGKTSRLMLLAKETGAKIACNNPSAMRQKAYAYGITGIDFISYSDLFTNKYDHDKILIDEIECFLHNYIDGKLIGYTLTNED